VGIGGAFIFLQSLAYSGYIQVDWGKVEREYRQVLDLDGDGKVGKPCSISVGLGKILYPGG